MNRTTFNNGFATLFNAFRHAQEQITPESQEIYWLTVKDVPEDKYSWAVYQCVVECKFFPTVSELVERIFPSYEKLPDYNPWGDPKAKPRIVTPFEQLEELKRSVQQAEIEKRERELLPEKI